jgi:hypothetical protein
MNDSSTADFVTDQEALEDLQKLLKMFVVLLDRLDQTRFLPSQKTTMRVMYIRHIDALQIAISKFCC